MNSKFRQAAQAPRSRSETTITDAYCSSKNNFTSVKVKLTWRQALILMVFLQSNLELLPFWTIKGALTITLKIQ